ncbi:MAG: adenylate/guanylate cyclase [Chloroflexi bacterium]|jgi:class 3 adenylate cyclase/tetratricopeptide (TPR) repeat protein|nr:adenylate/guanylate cyclase [Chloroflexota bacterium]
MTCLGCRQENREGRKFCATCGDRLVLSCPGCRCKNEPGERFCGECGAALAWGPSVAPAALNPQSERKQVTVLFADVKGSMDLAGRVDPEEWVELMGRFFAILRDGVNRFGGRIDKFTGDGIMALFGAPAAYEDHAQRACAAALHLREELSRFGRELEVERGLGFLVRMGLDSGEVVAGAVGEDLTVEYTVLGNTVGLAQRMESLAEPGAVYVTAATAALVEGYFVLRDLGAMRAKGVVDAVTVFKLLRHGALRTALEVAAARGLSRFVGREREMAALEGAFAQACEGNGQVVGIVAEPGLGKSRLCHEFAEWCRARGVEVFVGHGLAHARAVPFVAVLEILRSLFGISDQDDPATARVKVGGTIRELDPSLAGVVPLLYEFLGVGDAELPTSVIDPEARQRQILAALNRLRRARSARNPIVMVVEDLHWLDPGSVAFLENLVGSAPGTRVLVVTTFRPEYHFPWPHRAHYGQLPLLPLGEAASDELFRELLGPAPSLGELGDRVRARVAGNPFFIEEIVRGLVEEGCLRGRRGAYELARSVSEVKIPATVQAVLAARIDRLPERAKTLLQMAAVVGRQFSRRLVGSVSGLAEDELGAALQALVDAELVYETAVFPEEEYTFKHALTEEVAYRSQLARRRTRIHAAVARALAELDPAKLDERASLIAQHHELGGELLEAARWNARAAGWAGYSHPAEAARHWRRVRALTDQLDQLREAAELGINARIMLLGFQVRLGAGSEEGHVSYEEEGAAVFAEAKAFAEVAGQPAVNVIVHMLHGLALQLGHAIEEGYQLSAEAARLADDMGDPGLRASARVPLAWCLFVLGRVGEAAAMAEDMVAIVGEDRSTGREMVVTSPYSWCRMQVAHLGTYAGRLDEGLAALERVIAVAGEEGDLETQAWAHRFWASVADLAGVDPDAAAAHAQKSVEWAEASGGPWSCIFNREGLAISYCQRGEWAEAIEVVDAALAIAQELRLSLAETPVLLSIRARALIGLGDLGEARANAREAIAVAQRCGTRMYEAMARHQLARAILANPVPGEEVVARAELDRALSILETLGIRALIPHIHLELGRLAQMAGDEQGYDRELRTAHRLFREIGARGRAEEVASLIGGVISRVSGPP